MTHTLGQFATMGDDDKPSFENSFWVSDHGVCSVVTKTVVACVVLSFKLRATLTLLVFISHHRTELGGQ